MILEIVAAVLILLGILGLLSLIPTTLLVEIILIVIGVGILLYARGAFASRSRP